MMHVVQFEDKLLQCFEPPLFIQEDFETYKLHLHNFCLLDAKTASDMQHRFQDKKVHYLGVFDEKSGAIRFLDSPQVFDLGADFEQVDRLRKQVTDNAVQAN